MMRYNENEQRELDEQSGKDLDPLYKKWMSDFPKTLAEVETAAANLHSATKIFNNAAGRLHRLYNSGVGSTNERDSAIDHLEDAGLIPHRYRTIKRESNEIRPRRGTLYRKDG